MNIEKKDNDLTNIRRFSPSKPMIQFDYDFTYAINRQVSIRPYGLLEMEITYRVDSVLCGMSSIKGNIARAINEYEY